jgi:pimeloyl-ACP methyl ester carboxylesterase
MGVRTACAVAHLKPEWVQGLILIDLGFSGVAGGGLGEGLAHFIKILPHRFEDRVQARAFMKKECPDPSIAQYLLAVACREGEGPALTFPSALIETIFAARDSSVRSWALDTAAHGTPMLILRGEKSLVWSKTDFESERAHFASYPHVKFEEVADAGHGLPFERRLELASLITQMSATYRLS